MGVITQGILGSFSGKVGPVVGSKWKGIATMRSYAVPANPNTAAQATQRTRFSLNQALAKSMLGSIIQPYWNPYAVKMSGFNRFMQVNLPLVANEAGILNAKITTGSLESTTLTAAGKTSGTVSLEWVAGATGNGLSADSAIAVVYDTANNVTYLSSGSIERGDGQANVTVPASLSPANLKAFVFFHRGGGSALEVSDSASFQVS